MYSGQPLSFRNLFDQQFNFASGPDAKFTTQVSDVASELSHPQKPTGLNLFRQGVVGKADRPPCLECPVTNSNSGHVRDQALPAADASL
jgi:hypothetical protein